MLPLQSCTQGYYRRSRIRSQSETGSDGSTHGTPQGHRISEKEVRIIGGDDDEREEGVRVGSRFCVETTFVSYTGSEGEIYPTEKVRLGYNARTR